MKYQDIKIMQSAYRCFLYDAAVLILARLELEKRFKVPNNNNIGTNTNQLAIESALNKIRSLYDFFVETNNKRDDDLSCSDFGYNFKKLSNDQSKFRESIHKYSMHLTWERVFRNYIALPKRNIIIINCIELERWTYEFINYCNDKGLIPNGNGKKYMKYIISNITRHAAKR